MAYTQADVQALMNEVDANAAQIAALQARNKEIRESLAFEAMGATWIEASGTQNLTVAGVKLKIVFGQNYTINKTELPKIYNNLSEDGKKAINFKPELSLSAYKTINNVDKAILNQVITSKPALPTITYGK